MRQKYFRKNNTGNILLGIKGFKGTQIRKIKIKKNEQKTSI